MNATTVSILVAIAAAAAVAGAYLVSRVRHRRREVAEEYHHVRCPGCRRRLRYQVRQVGHRAECSNCGHEVTFPPIC
jgi:uncharacterized paraquat-inducible protein A